MYATFISRPCHALQTVQTAMVFDNPHTPYTMEVGIVPLAHVQVRKLRTGVISVCICHHLVDPSCQLVTAVGINQEEH